MQTMINVELNNYAIDFLKFKNCSASVYKVHTENCAKDTYISKNGSFMLTQVLFRMVGYFSKEIILKNKPSFLGCLTLVTCTMWTLVVVEPINAI